MITCDSKGRVALVTGASRGIGRGIAIALGRDGAKVAVNYHANEKAAHETVERIKALGSEAIPIKADVRDFDQVKVMVETTLAAFGKLDILVNNAGRGHGPIAITDLDPETVRGLFQLNVMGSFYCCKAAIPHIRKQPRGDIIFTSSVRALDCTPTRGAYNMAKAAVEALTLVLAKEEQAYGIRVNAIGPGLVDTDAIRQSWGPERMAQVARDIPFGHRLATPEDIANLCSFLVSDKGEYITGQVIYVHAGVVAR